MSELTARGNRGLLLLLALTLLLTVLQLGKTPFFEPDEGRYSEIPREMLATGEFITPHLNGVLYFEKPPLLYWSVAASMFVLGQNEWAARLPGMLATVGMILMTAAFAARRWGTRTGLLAGLVTGSSVLVFALARIVITDALLSFVLTGAVFAFAAFQEAEQEGNARRARRALYGLHVACALAVLTKGLIGVVLPGGAILVFVVLSGRWRLLPKLFAPGPLLVFLLIAVPWHVEVARRNPDFLDFYFGDQHFRRFFTKVHRRQGSPFYFVGVLVAGFLPWTGFFGRFRETFPVRRAAFRERATASFLWIWAILVFLFFTASQSKLIPYVEPIWAPLGVLLAVGIERARQRGTDFKTERLLTALLLAALFAAGVFFGIGKGHLASWGEERLGLAVLCLLLPAVAACLAPRLVARLAGRSTAPSRLDPVPGVAAPWLAFLFGLLLVLPAAARAITPWPIISVLLADLKPEDLLIQRGHYLQATSFYTKGFVMVTGLGWHELNFGSTREGAEGRFPSQEEFLRMWEGEKRVFLIIHEDDLEMISDPKIGFRPGRVVARMRNGKFSLMVNH
ncbi:MAG TPA: phospholipid carrier-dependent glycosyltransferase [Thermoanaerobaculia bacterium]|nr:phospholipid carrier-dependent glycosyltransferase [Thermoanaerobaculia bacterium]